MLPYLRAANVKDGALDLADVKLMNFEPSEQKTFALRAGDILITEGSGSLAAVGASAVWNNELPGTICFQNTLVRLRPRPGKSDGRYLGWWARAAYGSGEFASIASGANIYHISAERVKSLPAPLPPLDEQRRIADFLDDETDRVDRIAEVMARSLRLLEDTRRSSFAPVVPSVGSNASSRLGYHLDLVTSGPRGWGDYVGSCGNLFFRSANLRPDGIEPNLDGLALVEPPRSAVAEGRRSKVQVGDVLVGITGANTGWVSYADSGVANANVSQHVCLVRPGRGIDGIWLAHALCSPQVQQSLLGSQYGGTKTQLSLSDIRDLVVPMLPICEQQRLAAEASEVLVTLASKATARGRQLALLAERRQALITAAVTGQFDVTTARGVAV